MQIALRHLSHAPTLNKILPSLLSVVVSLYVPMLHAAPIYKIVDEKTGQVTFTDRPQGYEQKAGQQITQIMATPGYETNGLNAHNTMNNHAVPGTAPTKTKSATPEEKHNHSQMNYRLTMIEPSEARAYQRPAQRINVTLRIQPTLQADDNVSIYLDDKKMAQGLSTSIETVNLLPGVHTIHAMIKNDKGQKVQQIERTVYVIQNTAHKPNNKPLAKQPLSYQHRPWYQRLRQNLVTHF